MTISIRFMVLYVAGIIMMPGMLRAQESPRTWYFGYNAGITFTMAGPVLAGPSETRAFEGGAVGAHPVTGETLFYTDGNFVWDADHRLMENGSGLRGHWSSAQSALVVPWPCDATRYLLLTSGQEGYIDYEPRDGVEWAVVQHAGGEGRVLTKNNKLLDPASEQLTAVRHANGNDYWIVAHSLDGNEFYAYLLTRDGLRLQPVVSRAGLPQDARTVGILKASPDGRKLALSKGGHNIGDTPVHLELFSFDASTGIVSEAVTVWESSVYGISFSPDSRFLYAAESRDSNRVAQFQIDFVSKSDIVSSRTIVAVPTRSMRSMQLGPDGILYIASEYQDWLSAIEEPNVVGTGCRFVEQEFDLGFGKSSHGLPNNIDARGNGSYPDCLPRATLTASPATICSGGCTTIRIEDSRNLGQWWWSFPGGNPARVHGGAEHVVCFEEPGVHRVTLTATNGRDTTVTTIDVTVNPPLIVDAGPSRLLCGDSVAMLAVPVSNRPAVTYRWSPTDVLSCFDCASPVARVDSTTLFSVEITDAFGCTATDTVRVYTGDRIVIASVPGPIRATIPDTVDVRVNVTGLFEDLVVSAAHIRLSIDSTIARFVVPDQTMVRDMASGTPLDGWDLAIVSAGAGHLDLLATSPYPVKWGHMDSMILRARAYSLLSERLEAPIGCDVSFIGPKCLEVINRPGMLVGEICGFPHRLIESLQPLMVNVTDQEEGVVRVTARLSTNSPIRVVLHDRLGRAVRTISSDELSDEHMISIDMTDLSSGIYFLTLQGDDLHWQTRLLHRR